jgi:undecaprenyl-diphosphatase
MTYTLVVWVILIGYCRIYMGVHFPADIVGGWIVGVLSAGITYVLYRLRFDSPQSQLK